MTPPCMKGLFKGISDADEVAALVDAVSLGLRPCPHGQVVEQVAVVIRVRCPEATFKVPSCNIRTELYHTVVPTRTFSWRVEARWPVSNQAHLVQTWKAEEAVLCPLAVKRICFNARLIHSTVDM